MTNTNFEGNASGNAKARRGRSGEKRIDCPLLTLVLVIDVRGFVKTSRILPGNVSEPKTLADTLKALENSCSKQAPLLKQSRGVTVVMDAGIATRDNLQLLKSGGYDYVVVSRQKPNGSNEKRSASRIPNNSARF